ncbi:VOC family protein [Reinekea marinisedimentorum]|uniref:Catechol 2,3-dioxygenase-like lactoylglutathione lyase family enzyme n=1 Tax=Reinekea marinisedimentorum TaxID=230495 RepID=A0A4R3HU58_9GAMM|nr:VOC family protein [Reinekea marinisedimentorum]TCS35203.1 catechol 2,3-dioxygenase-like lactoylglutathione lyase family enzyme [Reinekea marinisedimentorum]
MAVKFVNTIVFVSDLAESKRFYSDLLGIKVKEELESIIFFENHLVLHSDKPILDSVFKTESKSRLNPIGANNILIYFECESLSELESTFGKVSSKAKVIHEIEVQDWGQKVFRFFDPDGHILEFGLKNGLNEKT